MIKYVIFILLIVAGVYIMKKGIAEERKKSADFVLVDIDSSAITTIVINPKFSDQDEITLTRSEKGWIATRGALSVRAVPATVTELLQNICLIQSSQIISQNPDKWSEYDLGEQQGIRLQIYVDGKLARDLIIGRSAFDPESRSGVAYLRMYNEKEVYAINGFKAIALWKGFAAYRDNTLLRLSPAIRMDSITFQSPDTFFSIFNQQEQWLTADLTALDTSHMNKFLAGLGNLAGKTFADDVDESYTRSLPQTSLHLYSAQLPEPVVVEIYQDTSRERPFLIRSTQNPAIWFDSDSTGIYQQLRLETAHR